MLVILRASITPILTTSLITFAERRLINPASIDEKQAAAEKPRDAQYRLKTFFLLSCRYVEEPEKGYNDYLKTSISSQFHYMI